MKRIVILIISVLVIGTSFFIFFQEGSFPVDKNDSVARIFVVPPGAGLSYIAKQLVGAGLIRNKIVFYFIVKRLGYDKKIQAGDFRLFPSMDAYEVARALTHGTLDVWITLIEGKRKEEIAHLISEKLDIPETEFLKNVKEGYLFPDTYLFPRNATAADVVDILTNNFNKKYSEDLQTEARKKHLSDKEVITLASLVEREAHYSEDRQKVAGVLLKRYRNDWPLNVDATIQYALGYQPDTKTWWKQPLAAEDLSIDSLYNTYKHIGLPPTPIANPGLAAIKAVIDADENIPYWFYVSDSSGRLHYAKTLEEHNANVSKYVR
ncbi:endolytic transglycosylase MltG [Candidatus Roizmanbacteria bacterium]|nr:endolytic transglycosylase MltG [Candidatus Roizmanbacteria bacterium]